MISILLSNVTLILGARAIFRELTWEIQHDQKIGLIGPNGAGKSSLLKVITGEYAPEPGGSAVRARGTTVGYLAQQPELDPAAAGMKKPRAVNSMARASRHRARPQLMGWPISQNIR